ncbi:MAG TPA: winged helix-turn-helix domain-containing protein [Thermoguttaceae bacterium]|nr:winged helix-turn-helix domain-containing protein [Thermoguttaceae bacterium]
MATTRSNTTSESSVVVSSTIARCKQLIDGYEKSVRQEIDAYIAHRRVRQPVTMSPAEVMLLCDGHTPENLAQWLWLENTGHRRDLPPECWFTFHIEEFIGQALDREGNETQVTLTAPDVLAVPRPAVPPLPEDFTVSRIVFRKHMIDRVTLYAEALQQACGWDIDKFFADIIEPEDVASFVLNHRQEHDGSWVQAEVDRDLEEWHYARLLELEARTKLRSPVTPSGEWTWLQLRILEALHYASFTGEGLAKAINKPYPTVRDALKTTGRLRTSGYVDNKRGVNYYRTDAPPDLEAM